MATVSSQTTTTISISLLELIPLLQKQYPYVKDVRCIDGKVTVPDPDYDDPDATTTFHIPGGNEIILTIVHESFVPK